MNEAMSQWFRNYWGIGLCLLTTTSSMAGEWAPPGTVLKEKSFVLTRTEAQELAIKKRTLQLELDLQKQKVKFYKDLVIDLKKVLAHYKNTTADYKKYWIAAEKRNDRKTNRRDFLTTLGKGLLINRVVQQIKF